MQSITVTIGRNVGSTPMNRKKWSNFIDCVQEVFAAITPDPSWIELHLGSGTWEGVTEDSAKVTLLIGDLNQDDLDYLRVNLRRLARMFKQDAIALVVAESQLIKP